jgi:hypothetical protein
MSIKKLFVVLFVIFNVTQISCKKDSDSSSIVGKWNSESIRYKTTAPAGSGIPSSDETDPFTGFTVEFRSNGTIQSCTVGEGCSEDGYYRVSGSTLTFSESSDFSNPTTNTIQTLTKNKLVIYEKDSETINGYNIVYESWITLNR